MTYAYSAVAVAKEFADCEEQHLWSEPRTRAAARGCRFPAFASTTIQYTAQGSSNKKAHENLTYLSLVILRFCVLKRAHKPLHYSILASAPVLCNKHQ